jgi:hypothetical protein
MTRKEQELVGKIQTLVGRALSAHFNDQNPNHMEAVAEPLKEAFEACILLLRKYPPTVLQ